MKLEIELACDIVEVEDYAKWLREQGHDAWVGNTTGTYINGTLVSCANDELRDVSDSLWDAYCAS